MTAIHPPAGPWARSCSGLARLEMAGVLATGEIWVKVPETIRIAWTGQLGDGLMAKDIMLALCGRLGMDGGKYQAIEYTGEAIKALSMQERMTLSNMAAELGGQTGLVAPDEVTAAFLRSVGGAVPDLSDLHTDEGAEVLEDHTFDATALAPQVAAPHSPLTRCPPMKREKQP